MNQYIIHYVEKVYYQPVVIEAESLEMAEQIFKDEHIGSLEVLTSTVVKLETELIETGN